MKPKAYIFDLDHTLCHPVNRGPYASGAEDEIIPAVETLIEGVNAINSYRFFTKIKIIILSGRKESDHLEESIIWLDDNNIHFDDIFLNPTNPCTKSEVFKREKLIELQEIYTILGVFDDDPLVADACKELGIPNFLFSYNH